MLLRIPLLLLLLNAAALAQGTGEIRAGAQDTPLIVAPADPAIAKALTEISAQRIRLTIKTLVSFSNRSTLSSMDKDLAAGTGITAAADWIFNEFSRISGECGDCLEVRHDDFLEPGSDAPGSRIVHDTRIQNIYAVLRGTDPKQAARRVLVTAHYDSRNSDNADTHAPAPGANDDASGVAVSLECARVLSKLKLPATIVFVAVAGEEQGLNGSRHLAKLARAEGWQLEAVLNNDIVGGDSTAGDTAQDKAAVRVFSEGVPQAATPEQIREIETLGAESDSPSRELARAIVEVARSYELSGPALPPMPAPGGTGNPAPGAGWAKAPAQALPPLHPVLIFRRDRFLRGGDHTSFNAEGFAAVRFTEWRENFDHQHQTPRAAEGDRPGVLYGDFFSFVDAAYVANVARLNAAALASFAAAPGEPAEVHIVTAALDNATELRWAAPAGAPPATTYEVVWRATDAPTWTDARPAGKALTLTLPIAKDNVVFGVRSVDAVGHRSPAVLPTPISR